MKIPDKITSFPEKIDDKHRYYVFAGVLLFIFLLDYLILMKPQLDALAKVNPQIKLLSEDLEKARNDKIRLPQYQKKVTDLKKKVGEINFKIRTKEEVPLILEKISNLADDSGIKIDQLMPITHDLELLLENNDKNYFALPIALEARGGYHAIGRFINMVELEDVFLLISGFKIAERQNSREHAFQLSLKAIVFE